MESVAQGELNRRYGTTGDICTRFRPRRASELIGTGSVKQLLVKAMAMGATRPKAYLLNGPSGCGKTTAARIAAMGLNCVKGDTAEPCLECESCKSVLNNTAMHVIELNVARVNTKEDAESMVQSMSCCALTGRNKVFIMDEVHMLTKHAQNLLLKSLEEPPPNTYIFLCTTEPLRLLPTVIKRCEAWVFTSPKEDDIATLLNCVYADETAAGSDIRVPTADEVAFFKSAVAGRSYREVLKTLDAFMRGGVEAINFIQADDPVAENIAFMICGWGEWYGKSVDERMRAIVKALAIMNEEKDGKLGSNMESMRAGLLAFFRNAIYRNGREIDSKGKSKPYSVDTTDNMLMRAQYFATRAFYDEQDAEVLFMLACMQAMANSKEVNQ
jgi:hypothetical protein